MKNTLRLFWLFAALLISLNGCGFGFVLPAAESGEESACHSESGEVLSSQTETSEESVNAETAALCEVARELLQLDKQVIDVFANLALAEYAVDIPVEDYGYGVGDTYYDLSDDCPYAEYSALKRLLSLTYTAESGVAEEYLNDYPRYGNPVFRSDYDGNTQFCCVYDADFDIFPEEADISLLAQTDGGYSFKYSYGGDSYVFELAATDGGYRLTDSLLFAEEDKVLAAGGVDSISENIGSAKTLRGNCLWVNVFVRDLVYGWDESSCNEVKAMVTEAGDYIVAQSQNYGVTDLIFDYLWTDAELEINAPDHATGATWAINAFDKSVYGDFNSFAENTLLYETDYDNVFFMFHFNQHGRSFSVPCDRNVGEDSKYYYENCVLFYSLPSDGAYFACSAVYMHEMLHLFGAADLYSGTVSDKNAALAELYFEKEIMRYEPTDIADCYIGDLTAKLLGWTEGVYPQLKDVIGR